jgi:hypothetical protein
MMQHPAGPDAPRQPARRRWLRHAAAGAGLLLVAGGGGATWLAGAPPPVARFPDVAAALEWLAKISHQPARSLTAWPLPQVLEHAAQSVEFSLRGYPELRSELFRASLGPLAFRAFARRGASWHDTTEPIPGAPPLSADNPITSAHRLAQALMRFEATPAEHDFAPHFAYGALDKDGYRRAHLMHLAEHAREVEFD